MSQRLRAARAALVAGAATLAAACTPAETDAEWDVLMPEANLADATRLSATVSFLELEGGVYVLRTADGTNYNPTNLPSSFREDGRRVEAEVIRRDDMASIAMVGPIVDIVRIRSASGQLPRGEEMGTMNGEALPEAGTGPSPGAESDGAGSELWGSAWVLEDLAGRGVVDSATATLEFPEPGRAAGNASCNQFSGPVRIAGDSIGFGPLVATRRGCAEPVNDQETRFLHALETAVTYRSDGSSLLIRSTGVDAPLRLVRR